MIDIQFLRELRKATKPKYFNDFYEIDKKEDFNIPHNINSVLKKLSLRVYVDIKPDDYKSVFEENRFPNVAEIGITIKLDYRDAQDDLIAAVANACPNVKRLFIYNYYSNSSKSFLTISSKCRKLEVFHFTSNDYLELIPPDIRRALPQICTNLPNLRYLELSSWKLSRKQGKYLVVHSDQLQAVLSGKSLFIRSSAQMSEVVTFIGERGFNDNVICKKIYVY